MIVHHQRDYADALSEGLMLFHALLGNPFVAEEEVSLHMYQGQFVLRYKGNTLMTVSETAGGLCDYQRDNAVLELVPLRTSAPVADTSFHAHL